MDYMKNGKRGTIDGNELVFIRCDRDGKIIPKETLKDLNITNSTIERIVSGVAGRIASADGDFEVGIISG